jgi:predicted DNA-binding protein
MYTERLQILVSPEQRRRLEAAARRRGESVSALIRDAVEQHLGSVGQGDRLEALDRVRAMRGRFLPVDELERLVEEERAGR